MISLFDICLELERSPCRWTLEAELQDHLERIVKPMGFNREVTFGDDRFDFYSPTRQVVIELKIKGGKNQILRQLMRYADRENVEAVILVSALSMHYSEWPHKLRKKPLFVANIAKWGLL